MKYKLENVRKHLDRKLRDPYFKEIFELEQQKLALVKKIISYRTDNNISQEELSDKIGVSQQHISKIENCEFSDLSTLLKVLLYVGFRVELRPMPINPNAKKRMRQVIQKMAMA